MAHLDTYAPQATLMSMPILVLALQGMDDNATGLGVNAGTAGRV